MDELQVTPISSESSCKKCPSFRSRPEFRHIHCRKHRACFSEHSYVPESCSFCKENKAAWQESFSEDSTAWKELLHKHQKNCNKPWSYGEQFKSFFGTIWKKNPSKSSSSSRSSTVETTPTVESSKKKSDVSKDQSSTAEVERVVYPSTSATSSFDPSTFMSRFEKIKKFMEVLMQEKSKETTRRLPSPYSRRRARSKSPKRNSPMRNRSKSPKRGRSRSRGRDRSRSPKHYRSPRGNRFRSSRRDRDRSTSKN